MHWNGASSFVGSMWFMLFFSNYGAFLVVGGLVTGQLRFLTLVEWDILVVRICIEFFLILAGLTL
jgi:hypothetical protein